LLKNSLYNLKVDLQERRKLIRIPTYAKHAAKMKNQLFPELLEIGGFTMPIRPHKGIQF